MKIFVLTLSRNKACLAFDVAVRLWKILLAQSSSDLWKNQYFYGIKQKRCLLEKHDIALYVTSWHSHVYYLATQITKFLLKLNMKI